MEFLIFFWIAVVAIGIPCATLRASKPKPVPPTGSKPARGHELANHAAAHLGGKLGEMITRNLFR